MNFVVDNGRRVQNTETILDLRKMSPHIEICTFIVDNVSFKVALNILKLTKTVCECLKTASILQTVRKTGLNRGSIKSEAKCWIYSHLHSNKINKVFL